ncbi:MAG: hypothetical protein JSS09_06450 [Verrucomicrobia bacterium]|nr:hypothetical protein [Verrucomicrobiota bacterium]
MKKFIFFCLLTTIIASSTAYSDDLQNVKTDQEALWAGSGAQDATFNAVTLSMLGWGIGLAGGIALIASAIHQSSSSHDSSSSSH